MTAVSTSVTAFVAAFEKPPAAPVRVRSFAEGAAALGTSSSDSAFALQQFFLNGGTDAWLAPSLALFDATDFNLLVMPELRNAPDDDVLIAEITAASRLCEQRGAFFILDPKPGLCSAEEMVTWASTPAFATSASPNCALYFPDVVVGDPAGGEARTLGPSATIAGIYAATDSTRGVWKAPAGQEAVMKNVLRLTVTLDDDDSGRLNAIAINPLRSFPVYGNLVWGARTRFGDDARASDWKYVPVRRLALFIEQSLRAELAWVANEPNDAQLCARMVTIAEMFMTGLWRQGAFQGATTSEAFFVKCDATTVTLLVGFAPLKPAEFILLTLPFATAQA